MIFLPTFIIFAIFHEFIEWFSKKPRECLVQTWHWPRNGSCRASWHNFGWSRDSLAASRINHTYCPVKTYYTRLRRPMTGTYHQSSNFVYLQNYFIWLYHNRGSPLMRSYRTRNPDYFSGLPPEPFLASCVPNMQVKGGFIGKLNSLLEERGAQGRHEGLVIKPVFMKSESQEYLLMILLLPTPWLPIRTILASNVLEWRRGPSRGVSWRLAWQPPMIHNIIIIGLLYLRLIKIFF